MSTEDADLVSYEELDEPQESTDVAVEKETKKGHYVGIHVSNFKDFVLKSELLRAVSDCGFEHPSEGFNLTC